VKRTISELFRRAVDDVPDKLWLLGEDGSERTYGQALGLVERAATWFRAAGLRRSDRVIVTARSTPAYLLSWLALMEVGAVQVPINPASSLDEMIGFLQQVDPRLVVADGDTVSSVREALRRTGSNGRPARVEELFEAAPDGLGPADLDPHDIAVMIPTSGTTGRSKLVMQTHIAYVMAGEGFPWWLGLTSDDRLMTSLPLFHINAPAYSTLGSVAARASLALLTGFSASRFIDLARRLEATEFNAIGAMLEILMRQPPRADDADNPLRLCYTGPAPERSRQEEMEQRFGIRIVVGYAMSESPYGLIWPRGSRPFGTLGAVRQHPVLGVVNEAKLISADGRELGPGQTGELLLRNPAVTPGYWGMPEETARAITNGWLHTGDLVTAGADGNFTFVGRQKEVLRRRGENLSPLEVEEVLAGHPAVVECAVVGVPSELSEEEIKAFIVPADASGFPGFGPLIQFAAGRLAAFKVPRYWQLIDELPRTPTARVAKHRLPAGHQPGEYDAEADFPGRG